MDVDTLNINCQIFHDFAGKIKYLYLKCCFLGLLNTFSIEKIAYTSKRGVLRSEALLRNSQDIALVIKVMACTSIETREKLIESDV